MALRDCFHKLRKQIAPHDKTRIMALVANGAEDAEAVREVLAESAADLLVIAERVEDKGGTVVRHDDTITQIAEMQRRLLDKLHQERIDLNDEINEVSIELDMIEGVENRIKGYPEQRGMDIEGPVNLEDLQQVEDILSAMLFEEGQREVFRGSGLGGFIKGQTPLELIESYGAMQARKFALGAKNRSFADRSRQLDERLKTVFYGEDRNPRQFNQDFEIMVPWKLKSSGEGDLYIRRHGVNAGMPFRERQGPNDFAITFNPDVLLTDYMFYVLTYLQPKIAARARGTAQQAIRLDDIHAVLTNHFIGQELFQSTEGPRMQAIHNLTADNLTFADKKGGLPSPSIAVLPKGMGMDDFGEITLIGSEELGDPQQVPLYDADAYAVRYPRAAYAPANREDVQVMVDEAGNWSLLMEGSRYSGLPDFIWEFTRRRPDAERLVDHMLASNTAKAWYLGTEHGQKDVEPKLDDVQPRYTWGWDQDILDFFDGDLSAEQLEWEHHTRVKHMKKAARIVRAAIRAHYLRRIGYVGPEARTEAAMAERAAKVYNAAENFIARAGIINQDGTLTDQAYTRLKEDAKRKGSKNINDVDTRHYLDARIQSLGSEADFRNWVDAKVRGIMGEGRIKIGNKWYPYELENIQRKMTRKLKGTETTWPSEGLMRAKAAERIKNMPELRRRALEQIGTPAEIERARDEAQRMVFDWILDVSSLWPHDGSTLEAASRANDAAREALAFWTQNKDNLSDVESLTRGLERAGFVGPFPDWMIAKGLDAGAAFMQAPVPYFEAKPQRTFMLNEFAGAVIPHDASPETRAVLHKHGIPYIEYERGPKGAQNRQAALAMLQDELSNAGGRTLFQSEIGFYSGLLAAARVMPREKGSAADMLGTLKKQPGVKKEELDALGVEEYLVAKGTVTREELVAFIETGGVQVKETFYAGKEPSIGSASFVWDAAPEAAYEALAEFEEGVPAADVMADSRIRIFDVNTNPADPFAAIYRVTFDQDAGNVSVETPDGEFLEITDPLNRQTTDSAREAIEKHLIDQARIPGSAGFISWHSYEMPGIRENSRELVLHLPEIVPVKYNLENMNVIDRPDDAMSMEEAERFWFIEVPGQTFQILRSKFPNVEDAKQYVVDEKQPSTDFAYNEPTHGFDDVLNGLVWLRTNDREGPNGERILFIEELQSSLHQRGAKIGYRGNPEQIRMANEALKRTEDAAKRAVDRMFKLDPLVWYDSFSEIMEQIIAQGEDWLAELDLTDMLEPEHVEAIENYRSASERLDQLDRSQGVLDFPFKGNAWVELAMKRIIRLAAEGGYDQIAWTTGEQQVERWGNAMQFDKIEYDPRSETLSAWDSGGNLQTTQHVEMSKLHEWIGAERVLEVQRQIDDRERQWSVHRGRLADVTRGDIYGAATDRADDPYLGFVVVDENGELHRDLGGMVVGMMNEADAEALRLDLTWENNIPTLSNMDMEVGGDFLKKLYDKVMVNVMNKAARKLDKKASARRESIRMQGGDYAYAMTIESDGVTYYVEGVPPHLPRDSDRRRLTPRFDNIEDAYQWREEAQSGFAYEQNGLDVSGDMIANAMLGQTLFQRKKRGSIRFDEDGKAVIRLTKARNLSTFLHESGHLYLEIMGDLAEDAVGPARIIQDYQKILEFLGVNRREDIQREHHEKWARAFEAYLREGKAPAPELRNIFADFSGWLRDIYEKINELLGPGEELTDDIRAVMDRMIATDAAISEAEIQQEFRPVFSTAESMGVSQEVFDVYRRYFALAHQDAVDRATAKMLKALTRAQKQVYQDERKKVKEQVTAEIHSKRVYIALAMLQRGTNPDGSETGRRHIRLSRDDLIRRYGKEFIKKLPGRGRYGVYAAKGGTDLDVAAQILGYVSGDEMIQEILRAGKMTSVIEAETNARMDATFTDPLVDGTLAEDAIVAVHNEQRAQILAAELRALRGKMRDDQKIVSATKREAAREDRQKRAANAGMLPNRGELAIIKKLASDAIDAMRIRDVVPNRYRVAEAKAGRKAFEAGVKGDYETAYAEKLKQIHAHEMYRASVRAKEEAGRTQVYLKKFEGRAKQRRLGKSGMLDRILAVIELIDLRRVSLAEVDRSTAMQEIAQAVHDGAISMSGHQAAALYHLEFDDQGNEKVVLNKGYGTNWQDLTVEEFRERRDLVRQLDHKASELAKGILNGEKVELQKVADEISDSVLENNKFVPAGISEADKGEKFERSLKQGVAGWQRPSSIARLLDQSGFGALTRRIIVPIRRAYAEKLLPMLKQQQRDMTAIYNKHYTKRELGRMHKRVRVEAMGTDLSKSDMLTIALNMGSASNREALFGGVKRDGTQAYTEQGVQAVLSMLDARDVAFINDVWEYLDSYWHDKKDAKGNVIREGIATVEARRRGVAPPRVQPMPFTFTGKDGEKLEATGGYYPLVYDRRHSERIKQVEIDDLYKKMGHGVFISAQTRSGSTFERTKNHGMVVRMGLHTIDLHLREVVRDIAIGDEVNFIKRLLNHDDVRKAFNNTNNAASLEALNLWLTDAAVGELAAEGAYEQTISWIRTGFVKAKLGWNLMTTALQLTGVFQTMAVIGTEAYGRGLGKFMQNPAGMYKFVMAQSDFMRSRYVDGQFDKDVIDTAAHLNSFWGPAPTIGKVAMQRAAATYFLPIMAMQSVVDVTTWLGAYWKGKNIKGLNDADAIIYADVQVENSQTSGFYSDRSGLERGTMGRKNRQSQFIRIWTTLISYMLAKSNIAYEKGVKFKRKPTAKGAVLLATDILLLYTVEGIAAAFLYDQIPDWDDEEDDSVGWWLAKVTADSLLSGIPFAREAPGAKFGSGNTALGTAAKDIYDLGQQIAQWELDDTMIKQLNKVGGVWLHYPSSQTNRLIDAYWSEEEPELYEWATGIRRDDE